MTEAKYNSRLFQAYRLEKSREFLDNDNFLRIGNANR